jgi:hypothetical protein
MTGFELFATFGVPILLVAASYIAVVIYERRSRSDTKPA